jgi:hypothetical protein
MSYPNDPIDDPCNDPSPDDPCFVEGREGSITPEEVQCAQQQWCDGLIGISRKYQNDPYGDEYRLAAIDFLNTYYDFREGGRVFFRPTLAKFPNNFRTTFQGTLDYFIGDAPGDGFAKANWKSAKYSNRVDTENPAIQIYGETAVAMGNVCLEEEGVPGMTVVDKVFVYRKVGNELKLIVHMSAKRNAPGEEAFE